MPREWILQQDNATCHTFKLVREWFTEEKIAVMELPAQSPNLNPIENLWDEIKAKAQEQNPRSSSCRSVLSVLCRRTQSVLWLFPLEVLW